MLAPGVNRPIKSGEELFLLYSTDKNIIDVWILQTYNLRKHILMLCEKGNIPKTPEFPTLLFEKIIFH